MRDSSLQAYGRCPLGHNLAPSGDTGDNLSTEQIPEGEEQPLYWSNYHQKFICKFCERRVQDLKDDERFHDEQLEIERRMASIGIIKS